MPKRIGSQSFVNLAQSANTPIAGPSEKRMAIKFMNSSSAFTGTWISTSPVNVANQGMTLRPDVEYYLFRYEDYGEMVRGPWYAFTTNAGVTITVFDVVES